VVLVKTFFLIHDGASDTSSSHCREPVPNPVTFITPLIEFILMESLTHVFALKALLILLRENRTMNVEEIADEMGETHGSVVHAIDALEESNLIHSMNERAVPYNRDISLTAPGKRVAEKLSDIEEIIGWRGVGGVP